VTIFDARAVDNASATVVPLRPSFLTFSSVAGTRVRRPAAWSVTMSSGRSQAESTAS
jgi:hypothetical protein